MKLRLMSDNDYNTVDSWLKKDYIAQHFVDYDFHLKESRDNQEKFNYLKDYIVELGIQPIGFAQIVDLNGAKAKWYKVKEANTVFSFKYFIGEEFYLEKGYGNEIVQHLVRIIKINKQATKIVVQAEKDNIAASKALIYNGFILDEENDYYYLDIEVNQEDIVTDENYYDKVDAHLTKYKQIKFADENENTLFVKDAKYNFIFDFEQVKKLDEFRYIDYTSDRMRRLDSSLVLAMNMFSTLTLNDEMIIKLIRYYFKIKIKEDIFSVKRYFHFNDYDMTGKASRVGLYLTINNKYRLYIETAYTQNKYKSVNKISEQKVQDFKFVYEKMLKNSLNAYDVIEMDEFYKHYQFYRNVVRRQSEYDYVCFLQPEDNHLLLKDFNDGLKKISHDNVRLIDWHDMIQWILENTKDYLLIEKIRELEIKYFGYKYNLL